MQQWLTEKGVVSSDFSSKRKIYRQPDMADTNSMVADDKLSPSDGDSEKQAVPMSRWWLDGIDPLHTDLGLLACCFCTGLIDCSVFHNYGAFVGMQTGTLDRC